MKRYDVEMGIICEPDDESGMARLMTEIDEPVVLASDVAELERRHREAVELLVRTHTEAVTARWYADVRAFLSHDGKP